MAKPLLHLCFVPAILIILGANCALAQETHHYTIVANQPSPLTADAGEDRISLPGESVTVGGDPAASGGTSPYTYLWAASESLSQPDQANPSVTAPDDDMTYTLTVTDAAGCKAVDDVTIFAEVITSIAPGREIPFTVAPNPAKGWVTIRTGERGGTLTMLDRQGKPVLNEPLTPGEHSIDTRYLPAGIYLLRIRIHQDTHTVKLFVP